MLKVVEHLKLTTLLISHNIEEAIMMADRLVILTPRPMRIHTILPINLPRPRNLNMIGTAPFAQLQKQAIQAFQTTVA
jgi:ABC-type nitrate/sulfonate/bicarbonate transport system ATPase subunit